MNKVKFILQAAAIALAITFTLSCEEKSGGKSSSSTAEDLSSAADGSTLTDSRDGKKYKTVKIGNQVWMAENLSYNADGSKCRGKDGNLEDENTEKNCNKYGRFYNWETAMKACPSGWHLPSDADWEALFATVGGKETAGKYLKAKSDWDDYEGKSGNGLDSYGFAALPGGYGNTDVYSGNVGSQGYWWSSSEGYEDNAYIGSMGSSSEDVIYSDYEKDSLFSVRCVKD